MPSQFGTDYSRFMQPVPGEESWIPFPHPMNDAQRVENARARARRAGTDIGSGYLNPKSGELQDPDRGFGRAVLSHPEIMIPLVIGSGFGVGALAGPAAGSAPALGNVNAITDALAGSAPLGGVTTAAASAGGSAATRGILDQLKDKLLSPDGLLTAGSIAAALASRGDGTNAATRESEEQARRLQAITEARMRRVDPLHEAVTQLAFNRLPVSSRNGITLPRVPLPTE